MRGCRIFACAALLTGVALTQQPSATFAPAENKQSSAADSALKSMFEAKIKVQWDALKNRDKKAFGELLADEYQGVETDGRGERNKVQAIEEVPETNLVNYTMWGLKVTPISPDAAFVVYEITMQFPPKSQVRYSRIYIGELWEKQSGQWKILHHQETHVR
jgi:hypothetical protein